MDYEETKESGSTDHPPMSGKDIVPSIISPQSTGDGDEDPDEPFSINSRDRDFSIDMDSSDESELAGIENFRSKTAGMLYLDVVKTLGPFDERIPKEVQDFSPVATDIFFNLFCEEHCAEIGNERSQED
jgi:hypothetical protein